MQQDNFGVVDDDSVAIDDDEVPVVIISRYRLAERIAGAYGLSTFLVVDEEKSSPYDKYTVMVRSDCRYFSVFWVINNPKRFHEGLVALHALLEQNYPSGKTLGELLVQGEHFSSPALSHNGSS